MENFIFKKDQAAINAARLIFLFMSLSARTFVLSENIPVANQVLPAFDREGVAVTY